jgi:hypothetical protein
VKRIYISGPISAGSAHILTANIQAFTNKAIELRAAGHHVTNPAENGLPIDSSWSEHMRVDIRDMMDCDTIHMLPRWQDSKGATLELLIARGLGFNVEGVV